MRNNLKSRLLSQQQFVYESVVNEQERYVFHNGTV
jgi:hypothetical protein